MPMQENVHTFQCLFIDSMFKGVQVVVLLVFPQTYQILLDKKNKGTPAFLKLGPSNFPPVTFSKLFHVLNVHLAPHNMLIKEMSG